MTTWICPLLAVGLAVSMVWIFCLLSALEQRNGRIEATQEEIDLIKRICIEEWLAIEEKMIRHEGNGR